MELAAYPLVFCADSCHFAAPRAQHSGAVKLINAASAIHPKFNFSFIKHGLRAAQPYIGNDCIPVTADTNETHANTQTNRKTHADARTANAQKRIKLIWNLEIYDFHNPFDRAASILWRCLSSGVVAVITRTRPTKLRVISFPLSLHHHYAYRHLIHSIRLSFGWLERNLFEINSDFGCTAWR